MKFKGIVLFLLGIMISILITGCKIDERLGVQDESNNNSESEEQIDTEPIYGGEIVVPILNVKTLNPLLSSDKSFYYFNKLIFEGLFTIDVNMDIKNVLVDSYNFSSDGLTLDIKLRENVKWHDGESFTSEDVKFTIDTIKFAINRPEYFDNLSEAYKASTSLLQTTDVEIIDVYNIRLNFKNKSSNIIENLTFPIIPQHIFIGNKPFERALDIENYAPIGTGPYQKVEYNELKSIVLEANDNYWNGKPYINTVIGKILKDNDLTLVSFESGQIDVTNSQGVDWEKYAQNKNVRIYEYISQRYEFLGFNFRKEIFLGEKGKALRKAIAYGIDRQSIIQKVYLGHATQVDVPIHPNSWLISEQANYYGYNVNKARELLESAGWVDNNGDGIYEDSGGKNLTIKLSTNYYNELRQKTANIIADNLKSIGVEVIKDYNESEPENLTEEMLNIQWEEMQNKIKIGDFDVILLGWDLSYIPNLSFAFHSSQIENGSNFIAYADEEMDSILNEIINAVSREQKRQAYEKIQEKLIEDLPYVSLFFQNESVLANRKINGEVNPLSFNIYNSFDKWYIPKEYQNINSEK